LKSSEVWSVLGVTGKNLSATGYQSENEIKNTGSSAWKHETGLLSIWILGMFNPADQTTIVIPYRNASTVSSDVVNDVYFGKVPVDRLTLDEHAVYFKGDGKYRSKIGLKEKNVTGWMGSYDAANGVLTLVKYSHAKGGYVNSLWEIQKDPYGGDAINAYNDGAPSPGAKPLGPFYELESSSPAAALSIGESMSHIHATFHIKGSSSELDVISRKLLNVSIADITGAFDD
jgi:hypothetical protein